MDWSKVKLHFPNGPNDNPIYVAGTFRSLPLYNLVAKTLQNIPAFSSGDVRIYFGDPDYGFELDGDPQSILSVVAGDPEVGVRIAKVWLDHISKLVYFVQFEWDESRAKIRDLHRHTETISLYCDSLLNVDTSILWNAFDSIHLIEQIYHDHRNDPAHDEKYEEYATKLGAAWEKYGESHASSIRLIQRIEKALRAQRTIRELSKPKESRAPLQPELGDYSNIVSNRPLSGARLYIDEIDSFEKVRSVRPEAVLPLLRDGYFAELEDSVQTSLEQILGVSFHQHDWGGEINDLYTANVLVEGKRLATAFMLKGRGLKRNELRIADCGKDGSQLVRLFESPAELFVVQFVGNIDQHVIRDVESKVTARRARNQPAWFMIIDGQETARLMLAYNRISSAEKASE